jgi:hypothetical protein
MAQSAFTDLKGPLGRALRRVAEAGPAGALGVIWGEAVGGLLASRSRPVRLAGGALTVESDPEFADELRRASAELCGRLNSRLGRGAVERLIVIASRRCSGR